LIALETQGWRALSVGGAAATDFYDRVLDDAVTMLLPGALRLTDRHEILASMGGPPWTAFSLEAVEVVRLGEDGAVVVYGVVATRDGAQYSALVSSTYARRAGGWRLAVHQQTPR
jgi:uncharacterized protein DUF4440